MIAPEIQDYVQGQIAAAAGKSQFSVSPTSYHTHNGIDSPTLPQESVPSSGVSQIIAGTNVTVSPAGGTGAVTVNSTASGAVSSVSGSGSGINVSPTTGAVVVSNTGVTSIVAGSNISVSGATGAVTVSTTGVAPPKFGGTGADGNLVITSGTTTLDLGGAAVFIKNYTAIEVSGTGKLAFSNPAAGGTMIVLRSQSSILLTSSTVPCVEGSGMGGQGAAQSQGSNAGAVPGVAGGAFGQWGLQGTITAGGGGSGSSGTVGGGGGGASVNANGTAGSGSGGNIGAAGLHPANTLVAAGLFTVIWPAVPGSGGGGGDNNSGSNAAAGTAGGNGGGGIYFEAGAGWDFTGTINVNATNGGSTAGGGIGGGGGGGGGCVIALYNALVANSGTVNSNAGTGGAGGASAGSGGAGGAGFFAAALNEAFA